MKVTYQIVGLALIVLAIAIGVGLWSLPDGKPVNSEQFSAQRVANDIEKISFAPHSLYAPVERKAVEQYLTQRLAESGYEPQIVSYSYVDSTFRDTISLTNLYLTIDPVGGAATSYIMLVAHYDSALRYSTRTKQYEPSYGAADDGYGIGVILEVMKLSTTMRDEWHQGVKTLFTDGEESGMLGMQKAWNENRHFFDKTALLVNVEARGVRGPALLFETSLGNAKIIELYSETDYPAAYSLSSTVYNILPNYTDFTIVKDKINGVNFSVIDNLYYYHTQEDKFANISQKSIQHYGEQIMPMVSEFLTEERYADPDYFTSTEEPIYFTVPLVGLIVVSVGVYRLLNILTLILVVAVLIYARRRINMKLLLKSLLYIFIGLFSVAFVGSGVAYLAGMLCGVEFKLINMVVSAYDYPLMLAYLVAVSGLLYLFLLKNRSRIREFQLAAIVFNSFIILATTILFPDNFFVLLPTIISLAIFILRIFVRHTAIISFLCFLLIILITVQIINLLTVGLAIGALGVVALILYTVMIVSLPLLIEPEKR